MCFACVRLSLWYPCSQMFSYPNPCNRRELADTTSHSPSVRAKGVRHLINGSMLIGGGVASILSLTTYFQRNSILQGLTSNLPVREAAAGIFPAVLLTQGLLFIYRFCMIVGICATFSFPVRLTRVVSGCGRHSSFLFVFFL